MRKGRDGEWKKWEKNNGENSGPLTSLQVDRLTATDCNAAARANIKLRSKQGQDNVERVKARLRQGKSKVKDRPKQGHG